MTAVRITKMAQDPRGFLTAHVTAANADTIRVDNRLGSWSFTVDPSEDPGARNVRRREILPEFARKLAERAKAFLRGDHGDSEVEIEARKGGGFTAQPKDGPKDDNIKQIAERMAEAGARAVKEAA